MDLADKVDVSTRASSGLAPAAALERAPLESALVLAERLGEEDGAALAQVAPQQNGSLDVSVNHAGSTCFAPLHSERCDARVRALCGARVPA